MRFWIEKTYPSNREKGDFTNILLSPRRANGKYNADIYSNMREININDIVLHLNQDNDLIEGLSYVSDKYIEFKIEDSEYYSVNLVNYTNFDNKIEIYSILNNSNNYDILLRKKSELHNLFYMKKQNKFNLAQGAYLTEIDIELYELITSSKVDKSLIRNTEDDNDIFPEGKIKTRLHKSKERNKKLIREAKKNFKNKNNGCLYCECCNFDFVERYGEIGEDFIEAHHTIPVHTLKDDHKSKISDIVLLCSNCHRMIHRKRPWLEINQLKNLLKVETIIS